MLIFLDVETTGLEDNDKICSVGLIAVDGDEVISMYELVNEGKKVSSKASSVNHITNEMIKGKAKFTDTKVFEFLQKHNNLNTTMVGHNINFDVSKLLACGFDYKGAIIDTLRVAKHLIKECDGYSLQYLRYELKLYQKESNEITPHNALSDAFVVKSLYEYLLDSATYEKMCELTFENVLIEKFKYGKYANRYIEEISTYDRGYLEWMLSSTTDLDEDLRYSIDYYLNP
ncbi:3'-5' exonuclease [Sulfurimonas sp.]